LKGTLHPKHAINLVNALAFAQEIGNPPNMHVTIHWNLSECFTEDQWMKHQSKLFDKLSKWLKRKGYFPIKFIWTNENASKKGCHTHLLLWCDNEDKHKLQDFLIKAGNFKSIYAGGAAIKITNGKDGANTPKSQGGILAYLIKQTDREKKITVCGKRISLADELGLRIEDPSLPIRGKRCGVSQNLSLKARQTWGWTELRDPRDLVEHLTIKPTH
jgi:hypothetical protein